MKFRSTCRATTALASALCCLAVLPAQGIAVDAAMRSETVKAVGELLREHYVFADKGAACAELLSERLAAGKYDQIADAAALAAVLTGDLQGLTHDKHLRVSAQAQRRIEQPDVDDAERERHMRRAAARRNFGFEKIEILAGNVGYLDLRGFMEASAAGPTAVAAMAFLENTDAVIIDLRRNGGGSPTMIQLLSSFFFAEPTHLNSFFWRGKAQIDQFWTLPHVPGKVRPDVPLYVLTSGRTFSAAEEFTYNLKNLQRATIVGETTGGGAHPGGTRRVNDVFEVWVPQGRAINPITETNWEGTGIEPHIAVAADAALLAAHQDALSKIAAKTTDAAEAANLRWHADGLAARVAPAAVPAAVLQRFAGSYGQRQVRFADDALWYQREGRPRSKLIPMAENLFCLDGIDYFRVRFEEEAGKVVRLVGLYDDGRTEPSPRDDR